MSLASAEEFADWLTSQGRAKNTVAAYRRDVAAYLRWRDQALRLAQTTEASALQAYVDEVRATRAASSAARAVIALRIYHRWRDAGSDELQELKGVPLVPAERDTPDLTETEVGALLAAVQGETVERRRDAAVIGLLYFAGLKASEAITLDTIDVTADGAVLTVDRDGPHERVLPAVPALQIALARWLGPGGRARLAPNSSAVLVNRRGQRLTRQGLWLVAGAVAKRAGVAETLAPNDLRRACGAHLAAKGLAPAAIAAFLGQTPRQPPGAGILTDLGWGSCNLDA